MNISRQAVNDVVTAFSLVIGMLGVWSYIDAQQGKIAAKESAKRLNAKLDKILEKVSV